MQKSQVSIREFTGTLPFCILCTVAIFTVYKIGLQNLTTTYILTLALLALNIILYIVRYKIGILFNFLIFLLSIANLITPYYEITTSSYFVTKSKIGITPPMEMRSFGLFLIYFVINFKLLRKYFYFVIDRLPN